MASPALRSFFPAFRENLDKGDAYILKNHGAIAGGKNIMEAFFGIEELEESAKLACMTDPSPVYELINSSI